MAMISFDCIPKSFARLLTLFLFSVIANITPPNVMEMCIRDSLRLRGIRFRLLRRKSLAAEQPVRQHEEEERRAKALVEDRKSVV